MRIYVYTRAFSSNDEWTRISEVTAFSRREDAEKKFLQEENSILNDYEEHWRKDFSGEDVNGRIYAHYSTTDCGQDQIEQRIDPIEV